MSLFHCVNLTRVDVDVLPAIIQTLAKLPLVNAIMIVCDPENPVNFYMTAVREFRMAGYDVWLRVADSTIVKDLSTNNYRNRFRSYARTYAPYVTGIEVINEADGPWLGNRGLQIKKAQAALFEVKRWNLKTMACYYVDFDRPGAASQWAHDANLIVDIHTLSVYTLSTQNAYDPGEPIRTFRELAGRFDTATVGIGEWGLEDWQDPPQIPPPSKLVGVAEQTALYVEGSDFVNLPSFVGFYCYWDFVEHCVLGAKPLLPLMTRLLGGTATA